MKIIRFVSASIVLLAMAPAVFAHGEDDPLLVMGVMDQLESRDPGGEGALAWDVYAWLGKDFDKLWISAEGERSSSATEHSEIELRYSRAVSTYWDIQVGVRHDFEPASRDWLAVGFNGLAPYYFDVDASLYIGDGGRTALRLEAEYEILLTQRLILSPEIEVEIYGKDDPAAGVGSGLTGIGAGLRLRYEIRREIAPYIGLHWERSFGGTADLLQLAGRKSSDTELVIGLRAWF